MIGAILGDMIGSPYEFDLGNKSKEFPLFSRKSVFTDDTVMTIAVAKAFMEAGSDAADEEIHLLLKRKMNHLVRKGDGLCLSSAGHMDHPALFLKSTQIRQVEIADM